MKIIPLILSYLINDFFSSLVHDQAHLHTWKQAQIILALIFSIGNESEVLPDHNQWISDRHPSSPTETPARIVLRALVSTLAVIWYLNKREASLAEIEVCHVVLRNAAINAGLLYRLKQLIINRPKKPTRGGKHYPRLKSKDLTIGHFYFGGIKFYYLTQLACFQRLYGLYGSGKDTELTERFHKKVVKQPLESISNQFGGRLVECARHMQKHAHAECMHFKAKLSGEIVDPSRDSEIDENKDDDIECDFVEKSRSKAFKKQLLRVADSAFHTQDVSFSGFPWLHPVVTIQSLFSLLSVHRDGLRADSAKHAEYKVLKQALRDSDKKQWVKLILIDGYKLNSVLRCGDLDLTKGAYFIRSCQTYQDDRRGPIVQRTSHAINSFVFAQLVEGVELVRILGIVLCEDERLRETGQEVAVYCVVVVLSPAAEEYLPYDVYEYKLLYDEMRTHPDMRIVNTDSITSPCFCVSVQPDNFRTVDDFTKSTPRFYCIPPSRINPRQESYTDLRDRCNTPTVDAFRSVADMNDINSRLDEEVAKFKLVNNTKRLEKAAAAKERRKDKAAEKRLEKKMCGKRDESNSDA